MKHDTVSVVNNNDDLKTKGLKSTDKSDHWELLRAVFLTVTLCH